MNEQVREIADKAKKWLIGYENDSRGGAVVDLDKSAERFAQSIVSQLHERDEAIREELRISKVLTANLTDKCRELESALTSQQPVLTCEFLSHLDCTCPEVYKNTGDLNPAHGVYLTCTEFPQRIRCKHFKATSQQPNFKDTIVYMPKRYGKHRREEPTLKATGEKPTKPQVTVKLEMLTEEQLEGIVITTRWHNTKEYICLRDEMVAQAQRNYDAEQVKSQLKKLGLEVKG